MKRAGVVCGFLLATVFAAAASAQDKPLIVYVSPNPLGVNDFLKLGKAGTERIAAEIGAEAKTYESTDPITQRQNLEAAAKSGAKVVVVISFDFTDMLPEVAAAYPGVKFLLVDACPFDKLQPNITCIVFREWEANFLVGAEAALTSTTGKVGAIGALDIPFIHRYTDAFMQGAKHVKPDIEVVPALWVGGNNPFSDPARGQQRAAAMVADNVDRVLAAAAGSNGGIFEAMQDMEGANAFGVDVNQCVQAPGLVMDNVEKQTDVAVEVGVRGIIAGNQPQITALGLKEGGMALTGLSDKVGESQCTIANYPDVIAKVKALREEIVSGALVLEDPMQAK
jgi:basic membrane protein A